MLSEFIGPKMAIRELSPLNWPKTKILFVYFIISISRILKNIKSEFVFCIHIRETNRIKQ